MVKRVMTLGVVLMLLMVGCQGNEEDELIGFVDGLGGLVEAHPEDCDALGGALRGYLNDNLKEPLNSQLRRISFSQERYSEEVEAKLERSLRALAERYHQCEKSDPLRQEVDRLRQIHRGL